MEPYNINNKNKSTAPNDIRNKKIDKIISAYKARILMLQAKQEQLNSIKKWTIHKQSGSLLVKN